VREDAQVIWIRIAPGHDVAVSRETYEPVSLRVGPDHETRILTYETLPAGSAPLTGGRPMPQPPRTRPDTGPARLRAGDVWAGESLDGMPLASVRGREVGAGVNAVTLFYGSPQDRHVEITQAPRLAEGLSMLVGLRNYTPPEGTLVIEGPSGFLRAHGRYVAIVGGDPESTIAVARALRPYDG
jgi:hypothetical protein